MFYKQVEELIDLAVKCEPLSTYERDMMVGLIMATKKARNGVFNVEDKFNIDDDVKLTYHTDGPHSLPQHDVIRCSWRKKEVSTTIGSLSKLGVMMALKINMEVSPNKISEKSSLVLEIPKDQTEMRGFRARFMESFSKLLSSVFIPKEVVSSLIDTRH